MASPDATEGVWAGKYTHNEHDLPIGFEAINSLSQAHNHSQLRGWFYINSNYTYLNHMITRSVNSDNTATRHQEAANESTPTKPRHPFIRHQSENLEDVPDDIILKLVTPNIHVVAMDCARRQALGWIQLEHNRMLGCTREEMLRSEHRKQYIKSFSEVYITIARERLEQGNI